MSQIALDLTLETPHPIAPSALGNWHGCLWTRHGCRQEEGQSMELGRCEQTRSLRRTGQMNTGTASVGVSFPVTQTHGARCDSSLSVYSRSPAGRRQMLLSP